MANETANIETEDVQAMEKAGEVLLDNVYLPVFIKRCSARGVPINDEQELQEALTNVALLKQAKARQEKERGQNLHKSANLALRRMHGEDVYETEKSAAALADAADSARNAGQNIEVRKAAALLASLQPAS